MPRHPVQLHQGNCRKEEVNLLTEKTRKKTNAWQSQEDRKRGEVNLMTEKTRADKCLAEQGRQEERRGELAD